MSIRPHACLALCAVLMLTGCRDKQITAYRAPKDPVPAVTAPAMAAASPGALPDGHPSIDGGSPVQSSPGGMAGTAVPTAEGSDLTWTAPVTWTVKPNGSMRKGSFAIKADGAEADLSITAFPGATGGLEANLNRWRGQVGLTPQAPAEVTASVEKFSAHGLEFLIVDYANGGNRLIGAIVPYGSNSWFFKLMGPDALVAAQKDAFREFLHTVKEPAQPSPQPQPAPVPPPSPASMAGTAVPTAAGSGLTWTAPARWTAKPNGSMRKGSFAINGAGGEADLGITAFPGATGGLEANLNRWRGQVGLPPQSPPEVVAAVEKFSANGLDFLVADYVNGGNRLIGAIVSYGGNSWFFKLMGPDATVAGQKETFREFLHTVKEPAK